MMSNQEKSSQVTKLQVPISKREAAYKRKYGEVALKRMKALGAKMY